MPAVAFSGVPGTGIWLQLLAAGFRGTHGCSCPAGTAARSHFEAMARRFPQPPLTYPVVTRSLGMVWRLLRHQDLFALLPFSVVRPSLEAGEPAEVRIDAQIGLEPVGIHKPRDMGAAAAMLSEFLRAFGARSNPAASGNIIENYSY